MAVTVQETISAPNIKTIEELRAKLQDAVALEFATIPVYLTGWWTISDRKRYSQVADLIMSIAIAEMRHMCIAANVLIATGGQPDFRSAAPSYPCALPNLDKTKKVELCAYGDEFIRTGLFIEEPSPLPPACGTKIEGEIAEDVTVTEIDGSHFFDFGGVRYQRLAPGYGSIGLFYTDIVESIQELNKQYGHDYVFPDDASGQNQYTSFGGQDDIRVSNIDDAVTLLNDIIEEGEGDKTRVWDQNGELTHYYAFDQLRKKKKYVRGKDNAPCQPSKTFNEVPLPSGVVPIPKNPSVSMYSGVAKERAMEFNSFYGKIVENLHVGFNGHPGQVDNAIGMMHQLDGYAQRVLSVKLVDGPGKDKFAAPTFELPQRPQ
ncbi:ferritin-like protein [Streptomyces sp. NPDC052236]|uniref:ferritin-like protein n=1 Tax=Streptomyces sp. NPDC052236 TaxID=3365686 RepID=UPI0037D73631